MPVQVGTPVSVGQPVGPVVGRDLTDLAGDPGRAAAQFPVDDDAQPRPGTERQEHEVGHGTAVPVRAFPQRGEVDVVLHRDRAGDRGAQQRDQPVTGVRQGVAEQQRLAVRPDRGRQPDDGVRRRAGAALDPAGLDHHPGRQQGVERERDRLLGQPGGGGEVVAGDRAGVGAALQHGPRVHRPQQARSAGERRVTSRCHPALASRCGNSSEGSRFVRNLGRRPGPVEPARRPVPWPDRRPGVRRVRRRATGPARSGCPGRSVGAGLRS